MDTIDTYSDFHKDNRKDTREKNYAPIDPRIKALPKAENLFKVRTDKKNQTFEEKKRQRDELVQQAAARNVRRIEKSKRTHNAENAQRRISEKCKCCKIVVSKFLDSSFIPYPGYLAPQRLADYNRHHKCEHQRRFNVINYKKCMCGKARYEVSCDHQREFITTQPRGRCERCFHIVKVSVERNCACVVEFCRFCKYTSYKHHLTPDVVISGEVCMCGLENQNFSAWHTQSVITKKSTRTRKLGKRTFAQIVQRQSGRIEGAYRESTFSEDEESGPRGSSVEESESHSIVSWHSEEVYDEDTIEYCVELPEQYTYEGEHPLIAFNYCSDSVRRVSGVFVLRQELADFYYQRPALMRELSKQEVIVLTFFVYKYDSAFNILNQWLSGEIDTPSNLMDDLVYGGIMTDYENFHMRIGQRTLVSSGGWLSLRDNYEPERVTITYVNSPLPHEEKNEVVEEVTRHGGAMSTMSSIASTGSSYVIDMIKKFAELAQTGLGFVCESISMGVSAAFTKTRLMFRKYWIGVLVTRIETHLIEHPGAAIAIVTSLTSLLTATTKAQVIAPLLGLVGLISDIVIAAKNTSYASLKEGCEKELEEWRQKTVAIGKKLATSEANNGEKDAALARVKSYLDHSEKDAQVLTRELAEAEAEIRRLRMELEDLEIGNKEDNISAFDIGDLFAPRVERQSGEDNTRFFSAIASFMGFTGIHIVKAWKMCSAAFKEFNTACTARKNFGDLIAGAFNFLPQWFKSLFCASNPKVQIRSMMSDVETPLYKAYHKALAVHIAVLDGADGEEIRQLRDKARAAYVDWMKDREANNYCEMEYERLDSSMLAFAGSIEKPAPRDREPFVVMISGDSGVGKSTLWPILLSQLPDFEEYDTPAQIIADSYSRQIGDPYWSGCGPSKKVILYDDFGQDRDEIDLKELIALVTKAPFLPNMPSLDPADRETIGCKGDQVKAPYVVLLSNKVSFNPVTLADATALNRRKHIHLHATFGSKERQPDFGHIRLEVLSRSSQGVRAGREISSKRDVSIIEARQMIYDEYMLYKDRDVAINEELEKLMYKASKKKVERQSGGRYLAMAAEFLRDMVHNTGRYCKWVWDRYLYDMLVLSMHVGLYTFSVMGGIFVGMWASLKLIRYLFPPEEVVQESGTTKTAKYTAKVVKPQSNATDVRSIVEGNVCRLYVGDGLNEQNGIFVKGNVILVNEHCFHDLRPGYGKYVPDGTKVKMYCPGVNQDYTFDFDSSKISQILTSSGKYKDACLYQLPNRIPPRRDIVTHFWDAGVTLTNRPIAVVHINKHRQQGVFSARVDEDNLTVSYVHEYGAVQHPVTLHNTFRYQFPSEIGDCGTVVMATGNDMPRKLLGIHVAGDSNGGSIALIVTRQQIERALEKFGTVITSEEVVMQGCYRAAGFNDFADINLDGKLIPFGVSNEKLRVPNKTDITPSPLHGQICEVTTKPAQINVFHAINCGVDIYRVGVNKYSSYSPPIPEEELRIVRDHIRHRIMYHRTICLRRKLTVEEAINGVEGYPYLTSINMRTSAGAPWCFQPEYRGEKSKLFDYVDGKYYPKEELRLAVEEAEKKMKHGVLPDLLFVDWLKDERRPNEKVDAFKTRIFSICPVVLLIIARMYFLPYIAHLMQTRGKSYFAIGMNKNSLEWHFMIEMLKQVGTEGFDGDYSSYDGKLHKSLMFIHYDLGDEFFDEREETDSLVRDCIAHLMIFSKHYFYCVKTNKWYVYMCDGGNPSGNDATTPVNTTSNEAALELAWTRLAPDSMKDLINYSRNVRTIIYGDDNVVCVAREAQGFYHPLAIQKIMADIGMVYGPADKVSEASECFKPIEQCSFLKNTTGEYMSWYVPLMEKKALLETLNWVRTGYNSPEPEKACEDNCNDVLRNLCFYGEEEFERVRSAIKALRPNYLLLQYRFLMREFLGLGCINDPYNDFGSVRSERKTFAHFDFEQRMCVRDDQI